jgi:RNA polymerase sigma-70 factor (ECF subfamily)
MTSIEHHLEDNHLCRYAPALRYYESPQTHESPQPPVLHDSIARLRAFSMLLCMDADLADELVEVTLLRSSVGADPAAFGPNLSTWLIKRLRSYYYREYARRPAVTPVQRTSGDQADILTALAKLRAEQREALILVDAIRISLGEAGRICRQPPVRFRALLEGARADLARHLERQGSERPNQDNVSLNFLMTV